MAQSVKTYLGFRDFAAPPQHGAVRLCLTGKLVFKSAARLSLAAFS